MLDYPAMLADIQEVYLKDSAPWVIGFSGGKDSTAALQMVFYALKGLPPGKLSKAVHVVSNDTLVENPAVVKRLDEQLGKIADAGKRDLFAHNPDLFNVAKVTPQLDDRFWVNLIGKGYPSPNRWFRWCTDRLKIYPTNRYLRSTVDRNGSAVVVLGTRTAESPTRAAAMRAHGNGHRLYEHTSLPDALVYAPIADLSNDEVWAYLLQCPNPWGGDNRTLLSLYVSASGAGECPFVIETGTQSCGRSRFGCWVCTVVDRDRSMENLVDNGEAWMEELLRFRDWLYHARQQSSQYVPRYLSSRAKFGPFLLRTRREMLRRLLKMQTALTTELISAEELTRVCQLLRQDAIGEVHGGLRRYVLEFPTGKKVAAISDFNILLSGRARLGPLHLAGAKPLRKQAVSPRYSGCTRLLYYELET
jgi:DNA sulfur modification protein DndC